ncbi:hypothetical protein AAEX28_15130 [Lentisphaerota bacterium WC36G]|nr:hypothetical protein LJT99_01885 [Lentisphaerae bacterium WC36]
MQLQFSMVAISSLTVGLFNGIASSRLGTGFWKGFLSGTIGTAVTTSLIIFAKLSPKFAFAAGGAVSQIIVEALNGTLWTKAGAGRIAISTGISFIAGLAFGAKALDGLSGLVQPISQLANLSKGTFLELVKIFNRDFWGNFMLNTGIFQATNILQLAQGVIIAVRNFFKSLPKKLENYNKQGDDNLRAKDLQTINELKELIENEKGDFV